MIRKFALVLPAFAAGLAGRGAHGQAQDTARLGTVVVSASKVPKPASTLTQPATVLLGEDLRARGVTRVSDALREVPGAALVQSGSYGALTSLFLRGGESRYTKVLIDGGPVNAPVASSISAISHCKIDRIEIGEDLRACWLGATPYRESFKSFAQRLRRTTPLGVPAVLSLTRCRCRCGRYDPAGRLLAWRGAPLHRRNSSIQ